MTAESAGAQSGPLTLAASHGSASGARDEDRLAATRLSRLVAGREAHLLAVADGHSGSAAAAFVSERAAPTLEALLQPLSRPAAAEQDGTTLAPRLQEALVFTLLEVNRQFAAQGYASGCSLLLALVAGDLLTVASLGSSRCTLDVGAGAPLDLSADHRINYNPRELERLWAAGCLVAPAPAGTAPSPYAACASDGVLRLWPGGLALARSFGDFHLSQAVLPLPHVKQVVLPPSGGRLVLATRPVWTALGRNLHLALRGEPLASAAQVAMSSVRAASSDDVDATVLVADVLPRGDSWQGVCARFEGAAPRGRAGCRSGGKRGLLRLLSFGRQRGGHASKQPAGGAPAEAAPKAVLVADYDTAALLGLATHSGGSSSRSSSLSGGGSDGCNCCDSSDALQPPLWFDDQAEAQMQALLIEPHRLWAEARLHRRQTRSVAKEPAERQTGAAGVPGSWLTAAAAVVALDGDLPSTPSSNASSPATKPGPAAFGPSPRPSPQPCRGPSPRMSPQPSLPLQPRSSLLAAAVAASRAAAAGPPSAAGAADAAGPPSPSSRPSISRASSHLSELEPIDEESEPCLEDEAGGVVAAAVAAALAAALRAGQLPSVSSSPCVSPDGDGALGSSGGGSVPESLASADALGMQRRRLPPLRTVWISEQALARTASEPALQPSAARASLPPAVPQQTLAGAGSVRPLAPLDEEQAWLAALDSKAALFARCGRRRRAVSDSYLDCNIF